MPHDEQEQRQLLQESLLPNHQKGYYNSDEDIPRTTNIGWLKNYFRGHVLPSIKRNIFIIILFGICLIILLNSQQNSTNDEEDLIKSNDDISLIDKEENYNYFPSNSKYEKFMTYLPHGDVFQQRDELEDAIFLAYSLGRTLITPPIILGLNIEYTTSQDFQKKLKSLRTDKHQSECYVKTVIAERKETKYEVDVNCLTEFDSYSLLRWDFLFNLNLIKDKVRLLHRKDFDQIKLEEMLNITNSEQDVYEITRPSLGDKLITLDFVRSRDEKLLTFDYLSGKHLIGKNSSENRIFWNQIDSSLVLNNPVVLDVSRKIIRELGGIGNYVGVHARLLSITQSREFIQESFSNLTLTLKNYFNTTPSSPHIIYLVTDLNRNDTTLSSFLIEFPYVTMLNDYDEILLPLNKLYNPSDDTLLYKFLEPLVNSIIVSNGIELFSVNDGIYSEYAEKLHKTKLSNGQRFK